MLICQQFSALHYLVPGYHILFGLTAELAVKILDNKTFNVRGEITLPEYEHVIHLHRVQGSKVLALKLV